MPARDYSSLVETTGIGIILLTLFGVFIHGTVRIFSSRKRNAPSVSLKGGGNESPNSQNSSGVK